MSWSQGSSADEGGGGRPGYGKIGWEAPDGRERAWVLALTPTGTVQPGAKLLPAEELFSAEIVWSLFLTRCHVAGAVDEADLMRTLLHGLVTVATAMAQDRYGDPARAV